MSPRRVASRVVVVDGASVAPLEQCRDHETHSACAEEVHRQPGTYRPGPMTERETGVGGRAAVALPSSGIPN
jgi:hypothetical protein